MAKKPIRVFYSRLSGRFWASQSYREDKNGFITITGEKYDVTDQIAFLIRENDIVFTDLDVQTTHKLEWDEPKGNADE